MATEVEVRCWKCNEIVCYTEGCYLPSMTCISCHNAEDEEVCNQDRLERR